VRIGLMMVHASFVRANPNLISDSAVAGSVA
jgi:hypothetical protein